jgi:hypothetical protein
MKLMTSSRAKDYRACPRLHQIQYELGFRPLSEADVLRFGTLFHKGLEAWWRAWLAGLPQEQWLTLALAAMAGESDPFDRVRAEELMRGYHFRWKDERYEVVAVEQEFETELRNPATGVASRTWRLAGKIDVTVREADSGRALTVEHKTSSEDISPGSEYWRRLRMDGQVSTYYAGAQSLGLDVEGCLYDVVGKPKLRPYKATPEASRKYKADGTLYANQRADDETSEEFRERLRADIAENPAAYFQRGEVVRLESEMEEAMFDLWQLGQQIREAELAKRAPRNPDSCVRYGRTCPYFDVCSGAASLEDPALFVKKEIHPELSTAARPKEEDACQQQPSSP